MAAAMRELPNRSARPLFFWRRFVARPALRRIILGRG
jgi:hypothetical protein